MGFIDPPGVKAAPLANSEDSSPATSPDNIYAVIDEDRLLDVDIKSSAGDTSMESLGLLGEIVNEMENRNLGSIYATTTAARRPRPQGSSESPQYANTDEVDEGGGGEAEGETKAEAEEEVKSNVSTTSSGYLKPISAVKPVVLGAKMANSTFKAKQQLESEKQQSQQPYKSYHASINRPHYSVPKGKGVGTVAGGPGKKEEKPQTPVKPVLKGTSSSNKATPEGSASEPLSNVARMQKKFETASSKK